MNIEERQNSNINKFSFNPLIKEKEEEQNDSETLGSYIWSFLYIILKNNEDVPLDGEITNNFLHEYIHFLQNMTTYYFVMSSLFDLCNFLCRIHGILDMKKNTNIIKIPYCKESPYQQNETYIDLRSATNGDFELDECIFDYQMHETTSSKEFVQPRYSNYDPKMYYLLTHSEKPQKKYFGAKTIADSMAMIAEQICFPEKEPIRNFPYDTVQQIANKCCPKIKDNLLLLFACCDISLMYENPAEKFMNLMQQLRDVNIKDYNYHTLYMHSKKDILKTVNGLKGKILYVFQETCLKLKNKASNCLNIIDKDLARIINIYITTGMVMRKNKISFMTDALEKGKITQLYKKLPPPMISSPNGTYTSLPKDNIFSLFSLCSIYNVIVNNNHSCLMYDDCIRDKQSFSGCIVDTFDHNFENCQQKPWENIKYKVCPFADVWYGLFGDTKVETE